MGRRLLVLVVAAVLAGVMGACGGGVGSGSGSGVRTVVLDVHYSSFSTSAITVRRGDVVRFVIRNHDPIPHELIVGDESVQDYHEHGTEAHHGDRPGEVSVAARTTAQTTYAFVTPGQVLFGCHLPGHWAYGMRGAISVR